jgi:hypothetical protein
VFRSERRSVALSVRVCGPLTRRCSGTFPPQASQFSETCVARTQNNHFADSASTKAEPLQEPKRSGQRPDGAVHPAREAGEQAEQDASRGWGKKNGGKAAS